ncbi:hypothetical protein P261_01014 [Lachnospiraceae bacterium TWA4]|nr:hypothetical protein P261_01014 [Lachnospiraceae bacterium TWA4]
MYLTNDTTDEKHQYAYASQMKIFSSIDGELLDVIIVSKEVLEAFSEKGYLYNLEDLLEKSPTLKDKISPYFISSSNNSIQDGLELSNCKIIKNAGYQESIYLGVISNTPRKQQIIDYLNYLFH